jgi:cysteine desulfurase
MLSRSLYLDNVSTTRLDPRVTAVMLPHLAEMYANPAAPHRAGKAALAILEESRACVADLVGCRDDEVIFTSSATEANNLALKGICRARHRRGSKIDLSAVEHPSVTHPARSLASEGIQCVELPVDSLGRLDLEALAAALKKPPTLVSVMHGNPEVGTLQPVEEAAALAEAAGTLFHTDATATAGILPGIWARAPIHLLTLAPHLFHGPKGIAALIVRKGVRLRPQEEGGTQEGGWRAGTSSASLAAGFGTAARLARQEAPARERRLRACADRLRGLLQTSLTEWVPTGDPRRRIPGHLSLCLRYVEGEAVVGRLSDEGILAGSGSACTREAYKESHVLKAMRIDAVLGRGSVHFSFGAFNREEDADEAARILPPIVEDLRRISPLTPPDRARS